MRKNMKDSKQPRNGLSILFADDEESLQELMGMELPRMGHTVCVCPDGQAAIDELKKNAYDCLLVDLDMPGVWAIHAEDGGYKARITFRVEL